MVCIILSVNYLKIKDVLVVCAKEGSSIFVAEQLTEAGLENIYYLSGGMKVLFILSTIAVHGPFYAAGLKK